MSATATALVGFIMWSIVLTFTLLVVRVKAFAGGKIAFNGFQPGGGDMDAFGQRVTRAHANSLEYLAIPVGLLGISILTGQEEITNGLALVALACRAAQSVIHMVSTSVPAVAVRANIFGAQIFIFIYWGLAMLGAI
ncbi:MAG: MAPEG family protein [Pseudomonadota bacterium]